MSERKVFIFRMNDSQLSNMNQKQVYQNGQPEPR